MPDGAPINTFDLAVVHSRNKTNIARLLTVLEQLDAAYRIQLDRRIRPSVSHLTSAVHQNRLTRLGWLDMLSTVGRNLSYEELLPQSVEMDVGESTLVRVLDLETLITIKEGLLAPDKDRSILLVLRRTLEEKRKLG